jgi:DNA mismatch endonuclease (patch repair protein)
MRRAYPSPPSASSEAVSSAMRGNRQRDTRPELSLRRELHRRGLRYRVDLRPAGVPCRVDVAFRRERVAVFVDGCFWHSCPQHGSSPTTNSNYWKAKLRRNSERDRENERALRATGWTVIRVWEHEETLDAARRVETVVSSARRALNQLAGRDPSPERSCSSRGSARGGHE